MAPATSAQLWRPEGVAVDSGGNVFISDDGNYRIQRVSSGGIIATLAGDGSSGSSGDGGPASSGEVAPSGVATDGAGNLFFFDISSRSIRKVSRDGIISTVTVIDTNSYGYYNALVAADRSGNVFAACSTGRIETICEISPDGTIRTVAGNGTWGFSGDGGPATSAQLAFPWGAARDGAGNLYIADGYNHRIRKVTPDGIISTIAGSGAVGYLGDGGLATRASFSGPIALAVDGAGNVFVADVGNNVIRILRPVQ
jgi:sugar lactone lactonase YvrE